TALDLAADPAFNGPGGFDVTHVVAAGYDSGPQLDDVPDSTRVLVLQNTKDVPRLGEGVEHYVTQPIEDAHHALDSVEHHDAAGAVGGALGAMWHSAEVAVGPAGGIAAHVVTNAPDIAGELWHGDLGDAAEDAVLPAPGVERRGDSQLIATFDGGWGRFGHDQSHYVDYVRETSDPHVDQLFASFSGAASVVGSAVAIDVSVSDELPDHDPRSR